MYKIIARTAWDYVEIGPFATFKEALDDLYSDDNFRYERNCVQSKEASIEKQEHPLIKEILYPVITIG